MIVEFKRCHEKAQPPKRMLPGDAGFDLHAIGNHTLRQGHKIVIPTGIAVAIPYGYVGLVFARSGMATKKLVRPANCVGVIDSGYRGEILVHLYRDAEVETDWNEPVVISEGARIAQLVILPIPEVAFREVEYLTYSERSDNGFGSTGE